jgi:hypothetical protein
MPGAAEPAAGPKTGEHAGAARAAAWAGPGAAGAAGAGTPGAWADARAELEDEVLELRAQVVQLSDAVRALAVGLGLGSGN